MLQLASDAEREGEDGSVGSKRKKRGQKKSNSEDEHERRSGCDTTSRPERAPRRAARSSSKIGRNEVGEQKEQNKLQLV